MRCRGCNANLIPGHEICDDCERDELHAERNAYIHCLKACLERLEMVDSDSESLGFIATCKPVIAQAQSVIAGGWVKWLPTYEDKCLHGIPMGEPCDACHQLNQ